jgi:hypothetical protein
MVSAVVRRGAGCSQKAFFVSLVASNSYWQIDPFSCSGGISLSAWRRAVMVGLNNIFI